MNRYLVAALAVPLLATSTLNGQSARVMPWIPLLDSRKDGAEIHCRWIFQDQRVWMEFSNRGKKSVHFNYYFLGIERKEAAVKNPRLHLDPDGAAGGPAIVKIPMAGSLALPLIPNLVDVRVGDPDEGPFWSERN